MLNGFVIPVDTAFAFSDVSLIILDGWVIPVSETIRFPWDDLQELELPFVDTPVAEFPLAVVVGGDRVVYPDVLDSWQPTFPELNVIGPMWMPLVEPSPEFPSAVVTGGWLYTNAEEFKIDEPEFPAAVLTRDVSLIANQFEPPAVDFFEISVLQGRLILEQSIQVSEQFFPPAEMSKPYIGAATLDFDVVIPWAKAVVKYDPRMSPVITFHCFLTGANDGLLDLDLSSRLSAFQIFLRHNSPSSLSVTVGVDQEKVAAISARTHGEIIIRKNIRQWNGVVAIQEITRAAFSTFESSQTRNLFTATLSGSKDISYGASTRIELRGCSTRRQSGNRITLRSIIDPDMRPFDIATINNEEVLVETVKHIFGTRTSYMEVTGSING